MRLYTLQRLLEHIYGIRLAYRVDDFLITDPDLATRLEGRKQPGEAREKLLVREEAGELQLALYLDREVMQRLMRNNPFRSLQEDNLEDFLLALEGVSHFLYLGWKAEFEQGVSLLELELQAEVDKFVTTLALAARQKREWVPYHVHQRLFEHCHFDPSLEQEQLSRYRSANHFAGRYCWRLEDRYLRRRRISALMLELRHFYRLTQQQKICHINSA